MSVSASAENLSTDTQSCDGGSMCLELALEGERLCKAGDCRAGVAFFQAAIRAGTDDLRTLSAIYSQLGNAYFYLGDYNKAMQFHKHDLTLARTINDKLGEAKASGNLGNTLKVMGKFPEAIQCCKRHLEISRSLGDKLSEGRALYNLGNVYHAQGKHLGRVGQNDPGHFPLEVRECLLQAVTYYEENLDLMRSLGDRQAMGRACGNLGNTCYLLGDFTRAIRYHTERLTIAREVGDRAAERRANSNLGNSHIFLGQFENAAEHYKRTLALAEELGDAAVEAQACYSLGNTYTLLREYRIAEGYHARHLAAARKLQDRVGEGRACWSLGNAHAALGNHEKALYYAKEHYNISKELGDILGMATAQMNVGDLKKVLGMPDESPEVEEMVSRCQAKRMDGQRATLQDKLVRSASTDDKNRSPDEELLALITDMQSERMDSQRAELRPLPKSPAKENKGASLPGLRPQLTTSMKPEDDFLEMIARFQGSRLEDQRTELPRRQPEPEPAPHPAEPKPEVKPEVKPEAKPEAAPEVKPEAKPEKAKTVPDEDFFSLIMRAQSGRMEDQRASIPVTNRSKGESGSKK
ncbi:PREDICTED: G-protein-signaling modulator 2 isoform X2 [Papilio polytes]|uniref:G-protein-signaling modulator 2 isoform X2 n=1 Tax=Papilio polytes TaxID=76194 RepID=UPI000675D2F7|nr:PREDICTED: G-protein-signaling modulator 2 isoform X2 [Papilio polytes]